jgi:6-methylsalicylic acid synthase
VHAAGTYSGRVIDELDTPTVHTALHAKAGGAWVLHELVPPGALDFLVLFSSTAPLVVLPGGSAYAAANSFLDGLAVHRRLHADDTKAIAWTVWRATGMGAHISQLDQEAMETQAFGDITISEALRAWEYADATDAVYNVVVRPTQPPSGSPRKPIFEHIENPTTITPSNDGHAEVTLTGLASDELPSAVAAEVHQNLATETGIPIDRIEPDRPFADLGVDSVMAIAVRGRLQRSTGLDLPVTVLWTHPTPDALTRYLCDRLNSQLEST